MNTIVLVRLHSPLHIITPPLGIGYLIKSLKRINSINCVFLDCQKDRLGKEALLAKLRELKPMLLGFQVFSNTYRQFQEIIREYKTLVPETRIIAGGPHISGIPDIVMEEIPELDYAVAGEGEESLYAVAKHLIEGTLAENMPLIPNLCYREHGAFRKNAHEFVDVSKYGSPAWEHLAPNTYPAVQHGTFHKSTKVVPIITSRGCPYPCTFCAGHCLTGKKIRNRAIPDVVDEIEFLMATYGFREFIIEDENFTFYKERVREFHHEVKQRKLAFHLSFPNGLMVEKVDEEVAMLLHQLGTYSVVLGIESGSPATLQSMKKKILPHDVKNKIRLLHKYGINVTGSFILGFRDETIDDINQTIQFALDSGADLAYFGNYLPLPGSEDFNLLVAQGEIDPRTIDWESYSSYNGAIAYTSKYLREYDLLKLIRKATLRFYLRPRIIGRLLRRMTHPVFMRNLFIRALHLFVQ